MLQEGPPHPGPEGGLFPTLKSELSKESTVLTKRETSGKGTWVESRRIKGLRRTALPHDSRSGVYGDGVRFLVVLANLSDSGSFLVACTSLSQDDFQWGGFWEVVGCVESPFWPFLNSPSWWGFVSFLFLNRTSCHKIAQAHGYNRAWPGWAVSVTL